MNFDISKMVYFNVCFCNVDVYFHPRMLFRGLTEYLFRLKMF